MKLSKFGGAAAFVTFKWESKKKKIKKKKSKKSTDHKNNNLYQKATFVQFTH